MNLIRTYINYSGNIFFRVLEKIPGINLTQIMHGPDDLNFILVPKCGTRSVRDAILNYYELPLSEKWRAWSFIRYTKKVPGKSPYIIILRPPLERIYSCWKQKVSDERSGLIFYFWQYYPVIRPGMDFGEFIAAVSVIPVHLREKHFISLEYLIKGADIEQCKFVPLSALDFNLNQWFGRIIPSANVTRQKGISDLDEKAFNQLLKQDYAFDLNLYQRSIVSNLPSQKT
jgi:hypothetical protein